MKRKQIVIVAISFIVVGLMISVNATSILTKQESGYNEGVIFKNIIDTKQDDLLKQNVQTLAAGDDIWLTPFYGDDYMPAITVDGMNNVVVTWTNEETFTTSHQGIIHTNDPEDEAKWQENAYIFTWNMENPVAWDIAYITGDYWSGLAGGAYDYGELQQAGFMIDDINDLDNTLQGWTWSGENPDFISTEIVDQEVATDDYGTGWTEALIYHFNEQGYDIPGCPYYTRTDPIALSGGGYFDGQDNDVDTGPSNAYDYFIKDSDTTHHVMTNDETGKIIWKMTKLSVDPDIEFTPYQATIGDGSYAQMTGNTNTILIACIDAGNVKALYSTDDGTTWQTSTIGSGSYTNVCEVNGVFYCVFTDDGNLYRSESENGGASWSTPTQINDVDGTVVEGLKYFDIHKGGIVWTDERGEDWDVYYQSLETGPAPILTIDGIGGGFGASATINNIGTADATNVQWTISAEGTVFVGGEKTGTISSIPAGGSAAISSFLLGFGGVDITIEATSDEGAGARESVTGNLLLFFLQL